MNFIALKMLLGDRTKYAGLLFGIAFTSFLVTFAASCFGGIGTPEPTQNGSATATKSGP